MYVNIYVYICKYLNECYTSIRFRCTLILLTDCLPAVSRARADVYY